MSSDKSRITLADKAFLYVAYTNAPWSFVDEGAFHIHGDYIFHNFNLIRISGGKLPFYYGIGARIKTANKTRFGVRVPLGLAYIF